MDLDAVATRWAPLLDDLPERRRLLASLAPRYAEAHRAYHGLDHIEALAQLYVEVEDGPGWRAPAEVKLAILFHDAIYEPGRPDNEARSAALAREQLAGATTLDVERIAMMVEATKTHDQLGRADDHDLAHFLDADMAILGAPAPVYDAYVEAVRREFSAVPAALFRRGRRAFVEAQLARSALFHSPWFRARYGAQARANLERELGRDHETSP